MELKTAVISTLAILLWLTVPAMAQDLTLVVPDGQKKIGSYVWVWHTARVTQTDLVNAEADCPVGYVVLGGGYNHAGRRFLPASQRQL